MKNVFGNGQLGVGRMDKQALTVMIMAVCLIAVDRQQRKQRNQLQGLAHHVGDGNIVSQLVIGIQGQNASGQRVHHVPAGRFHDDVPDKAGRQRHIIRQNFFELCQFADRGQLAEQQ